MLKYGIVCNVLLALIIFFLVLEEITHLVLCVMSVIFLLIFHFVFSVEKGKNYVYRIL